MVLLLAGSMSALEWTTLAPPARCAAKAAVDSANQRAVLFGGTTVYANGAYLNDVWELGFNNVGRHEWHRLNPTGTPPSGRADHVMVYDPHGERMVVFGGSPQRYVHVNDVWMLSLTPRAEAWQQLSPAGAPPGGRGYAFGIYHPGRRSDVVFGGYSSSTLYDDVWELKLDSMVWRRLVVSGTPPSARYDGAAVYDAARDRMLVFGGRTQSGFVKELWALSLTPGSESWTRLNQAGSVPSGRAGFAWAAAPGGSGLCICAGWDGDQLFNDLYMLDVATLTWTALYPTGELPPGRRNCSGFADWVNGNFFVFGGEGEVGYLGDTHFAGCAVVGASQWMRPAGPGADLVLRIASVTAGSVRCHCAVTRPCEVRADVVDVAGKTVRELFREQVEPPGRWFIWDGRDAQGERAPTGNYYCRVESGSSVVAEKFALVR
jgi:hypothetical protein